MRPQRGEEEAAGRVEERPAVMGGDGEDVQI